MQDNLYLALRQIAFGFIEADKTVGKEVKYEDINSYIDRTLVASPIPCDDETKRRLFTDIEYQFQITHAKGHVIFDNYDNANEWYSNDNIENPYFWNRYKALLMANPSFNIKSINLLDEDTLPNIMNCLGNPKDHSRVNALEGALLLVMCNLVKRQLIQVLYARQLTLDTRL